MATLADYRAVQSNIFVKLTIQEYASDYGRAYTPNILTFSDDTVTRNINGVDYLPLGKLMGISQTSSDLKVTGNQLNITIAGVPNSSIFEIVNSKIKTSAIEVFRAFYNPTDGTLLPITPNPIGRFIGIVSNYSLEEQWDSYNKSSTNTLILVCSSQVDILGKKIAGRCTSPSSMKKFFPNDASMDRVPVLEKATFDFGKQSSSTGSATASQQSGFDFINNL
jgi:hypothetical protein